MVLLKISPQISTDEKTAKKVEWKFIIVVLVMTWAALF